MILKFDDDAIYSFIIVLNKLNGWNIQGDWKNNGFPEFCFIVRADDNGLTICDQDVDGYPQHNTTWTVGYDEINSITIV